MGGFTHMAKVCSHLFLVPFPDDQGHIRTAAAAYISPLPRPSVHGWSERKDSFKGNRFLSYSKPRDWTQFLLLSSKKVLFIVRKWLNICWLTRMSNRLLGNVFLHFFHKNERYRQMTEWNKRLGFILGQGKSLLSDDRLNSSSENVIPSLPVGQSEKMAMEVSQLLYSGV